MYRTARIVRHLTNDPNYLSLKTKNVRSVDEVLKTIELNSKPTNRLDQISVKKSKTKSTVKTKRLKTSSKSEESQQSSESNPIATQNSDIVVFKVIYGLYKPNKKHKQFSCDGFLTVNINSLSVCLYSIGGKSIQSHNKPLKNINDYESGKRLVIGSQEVEIDSELSAEEFKAGVYFEKTDG